MRPINIGEFRDRLEVFRQTKVADGIGGFTTSWDLDRVIWGKVEEMSESRILNVGQISYLSAYKITLRTDKEVLQGDFSSNDFNPGDFITAVAANRFSEQWKVRHEGRDIILFSILERKRWVYVLQGYTRIT